MSLPLTIILAQPYTGIAAAAIALFFLLVIPAAFLWSCLSLFLFILMRKHHTGVHLVNILLLTATVIFIFMTVKGTDDIKYNWYNFVPPAIMVLSLFTSIVHLVYHYRSKHKL